jgi:hypothetical protein
MDAATRWLVLRHNPSDRRVAAPFCFATEAEARAHAARLQRASSALHSIVAMELERRPADYEHHLPAAEAALTTLDPDGTADSRYVVEPTYDFTGAADDVAPVFAALLGAYAALPNPPATPTEAIYRLLRDASEPAG